MIEIRHDFARQSTMAAGFAAVAQALAEITETLDDIAGKVQILMTEDATVAAEVTQISASEAATLAAVRNLQNLIQALQTEQSAGVLSQGTLNALSQATAAANALAAEAQADVTADAPPSGA
jgi:hypothetical protein